MRQWCEVICLHVQLVETLQQQRPVVGLDVGVGQIWLDEEVQIPMSFLLTRRKYRSETVNKRKNRQTKKRNRKTYLELGLRDAFILLLFLLFNPQNVPQKDAKEGDNTKKTMRKKLNTKQPKRQRKLVAESSKLTDNFCHCQVGDQANNTVKSLGGVLKRF